MNDQEIVELCWSRSEHAVDKMAEKYGSYCYSIAFNILVNREDAEESVNDTYLAAWSTIPPKRPVMLSTFLGKLTRRISIDRLRRRTADKRGGGEIDLVLEELEYCIAGNQNMESDYIHKELSAAINRFLDTLPQTERNVFLCRYWYLDSVIDIASYFDFSQSKVTSMLLRIRESFGHSLKGRGIYEFC